MIRLRRARLDDAAALRVFLSQLSERTAFQRFAAGLGQPPQWWVERLTLCDDDHGSWVAVDGPAVVAHGQWTRVDDTSAEMALVVRDDWQGRGLGGVLAHEIAAEARTHLIGRLHFAILASNDVAARMVTRIWPDAVPRPDGGLLVYDVAA